MTTRELLIACAVVAEGVPFLTDGLKFLIFGYWNGLAGHQDEKRLKQELIDDLGASDLDLSFLKIEEAKS